MLELLLLSAFHTLRIADSDNHLLAAVNFRAGREKSDPYFPVITKFTKLEIWGAGLVL